MSGDRCSTPARRSTWRRSPSGPSAVGAIDITASPTQNLRWIAKSTGEDVRDLTAVILDRPRHADADRGGAGVGRPDPADHRRRRVRRGSPPHGHAPASTCCSASAARPEGVVAAAALKCMGGEIQGRLWPAERRRAGGAGRRPASSLDAVLTTDDLVRSDNCFFAATGITDGPLLSGVRVEGAACPPRAW